jgi:four helix bundle protein
VFCADFAADDLQYQRRQTSGSASGSVAANCIEANEALGNRDRVMRFRISRKEAKECELWLRLINVGENEAIDGTRESLRQEADELKLIFTAIIKKLE